MDLNDQQMAQYAAQLSEIYREFRERCDACEATVKAGTAAIKSSGSVQPFVSSVELLEAATAFETSLRRTADAVRDQRAAMAAARRGTGDPIEDELSNG